MEYSDSDNELLLKRQSRPFSSIFPPKKQQALLNNRVGMATNQAKMNKTYIFGCSIYWLSCLDVDIATDSLNKSWYTIGRYKQAIQVIFSQRKDAIIHLSVLLNGSEVAVKSEHKILSMILDSKLNFQSHIRQAVIKERRCTRIIPCLSKYVSQGVLDQIYKLYVPPHLCYDDIIHHKYDPEFKLDFHPVLMVWN